MDKRELREKVEKALDTIRPHLKSDGGDIEIVAITDDNVVQVRLLGACGVCAMSYITMKAGVEQTIRTAIPEIGGVEPIDEICL